MFHDVAASRYAKLVSAEAIDELAAERDRIIWLGTTDAPGASVLEWRETDEGACLVTSAVAGVSADQLNADELQRAWPGIVEAVRMLHALPSTECPFDRDLTGMIALARDTVASGRVQSEFLPVDLQDVPPVMILDGLELEFLQRRDQERRERVVCHGDLCLPNIIVDPTTTRVSGMIDVGRLGCADPYADIALLLATARETWPAEETAREADRVFADQYGIDLDTDRQQFYLRLDPLTWPS